MTSLHLVAPGYLEAAGAIPAPRYERDLLPEIRATVDGIYTASYPSTAGDAGAEVAIPGLDGAPPVRALLYRPSTATGTTAAILHIHGGGWVAGTADMMGPFCHDLADRHGVTVLSVDYRRAPEAPFPAPLDDCRAALGWLHDNAGELGVDTSRVALLGDSAGGNLAAALALRSRDEGRYPLSAQLLVYPALDDRTGTDDAPVDNPHAGEFVITRSYLRDLWRARTDGRPLPPSELGYFAPGRSDDLANLPPAWIAVGGLDLFAEEDAAYALRLARAGVPAELHVYDGVFHGFDLVPGPTTDRFTADLASAVDRLVVAARRPAGLN